MSEPGDHPSLDAEQAERVERRWATLSIFIVLLWIAVAAFAGIHQVTMPQTRMEIVDPRTLHLAGEFLESNLGSAVEPDGSVTVRAIAQQYSFTPPCIVVPAGTLVTFRATSADVVHGFLIEGSNVNTMLVPGYIASISVRFATRAEHSMPCHEFCGVGHHGMWGKVKVIDSQEFQQLAAARRRSNCVE